MKNNLLPFIAFLIFVSFSNFSFAGGTGACINHITYYPSCSAAVDAVTIASSTQSNPGFTQQYVSADDCQYYCKSTVFNPQPQPPNYQARFRHLATKDFSTMFYSEDLGGYQDIPTCTASQIYNSETNICEENISAQCTVDEYYKPSINQCLTIPVCPVNYSFDTTLEECYLNTIDANTPVGSEKVFYRTYPDWVDGPYVVDPAGGVWEVTDQISYGDQIGDVIVVKVIKTDLTDIPEGEYDWRIEYDDIDPATGDPYINPNTATPEEFSYEQFSLTNTYTSGPLFTETTKTSIVNGELETVETEVSTSTNSDTGTVTETTTTTTTNLGGSSSSTSTTTETLLGGSAVVTQTSSAAQTGIESDDLPDSTIVGGNTCGNPPVCSGDVLLCGLIQQTYKTRCNIVQEIPDSDDGGLAALQDGVTADLDSFGEGIISSFGETDALSDFNAAPSDLVAEFNNLFPVSACQDFTFTWKSSAFTLTCEKTALLRLIMAWAAGIYTLFALYTIAFQRTPDKV